MVVGFVQNLTIPVLATAVVLSFVLNASASLQLKDANEDISSRLSVFQVLSSGENKRLKNNEHIVIGNKSERIKLACEYEPMSSEKETEPRFLWSPLKYSLKDRRFVLTPVISVFRPATHLANSSIFRSEYDARLSDNSSAICCIILNKCQMTVMLDYKLPPLVSVYKSNNSITCEVLSFQRPNSISVKYEEGFVGALQVSHPANETIANVYRKSSNSIFWGLYSCRAKSVYGATAASACITPNGETEDKPCNIQLPTGDICKNDGQCQSHNCEGHLCNSILQAHFCSADDECQGYAQRSVCRTGNCKCPAGEKLKETDVGGRICLGSVTLHHICNKNSTCVDENSICLDNVCDCLKGYVSRSNQCVVQKAKSNENLPMFIGISVCVGVFLVVLVVMMIMKKAHLCEIVPSPEERASESAARSRLRSSFLGTLRRSFMRRTPPPSYSRATKPPSYQEAMQMRQEMPELGMVLTIPCNELNYPESINITENATSCIVSDAIDTDNVENVANREQNEQDNNSDIVDATTLETSQDDELRGGDSSNRTTNTQNGDELGESQAEEVEVVDGKAEDVEDGDNESDTIMTKTKTN